MKTLINLIIFAYVIAYAFYPEMRDDILLWGEITLFASVIFILIAYFWLAPKDLFFTFGKQNRAKFKAKANGQIWTGGFIFPSNKTYIEPKTYDIKDITPETPKSYYQRFNIFGMYWLGIPLFYSIYHYRQTWQEWQLVNDKQVLVTRSGEKNTGELTPYLFVKRFPYGVILKEAENLDGYPLNISIEFYLTPTNARRAVFGNDKAIKQIYSLVLGLSGIYSKTHSFATILGEKKSLSDTSEVHDGLSNFLRGLNTQIPGEEDGANLDSVFGYRIEGAKILDVEPSGSEKGEIAKATIKVALAKEKKNALIIEAQGIAQARDIDTESLEKYYAALTKNPGAVEIEVSKNMFGPDSKLTTLVTNGNTVTNIPLGGKKGDGDE